MARAAVVGLAIACGTTTLAGQAPAPEAFTATASVKQGQASASFPVRVSVTRWASDSERDAIRAAAKKGGDAIHHALGGMTDAGFVEVGTQRTPIKFAGQRDTGGGGRLVTVATAAPILFLGAGLPDAKPRAGFDSALVILVLSGGSGGTGELAPAAKIGINESGALVTTDYASAVVLLNNVSRVPPK